jgi:hypothetical protein
MHQSDSYPLAIPCVWWCRGNDTGLIFPHTCLNDLYSIQISAQQYGIRQVRTDGLQVGKYNYDVPLQLYEMLSSICKQTIQSRLELAQPIAQRSEQQSSGRRLCWTEHLFVAHMPRSHLRNYDK